MAVHILRLKRTDKPGQHLLLHVSQTGSRALDLKCIGTEHEHLYHANIQESNLKSLQANNYSGDLEEWKTTVKYALLHEKPTTPLPPSLQGLETIAAISGKTLTVTLRKNVEGITQRLGSIKLDQDDEREEVSPFEWVDISAASGDALRTELDALQASVSGQQDEVKRLTKQLDGLVQAKKEHEEELLKKFAALLNAKKLKIRDQQRLLAGAKVDPKAAEAVGEARGSSGRGKKSGGSRSGKKRKADEVEEVEEEQAEDANGEGEDVSEYDEVRQETPPRSEEEEVTEDEDEDDLDAPSKANGTGGKGKGKAAETRKRADEEEMEVDDGPPPRRELRFARKDSPPTTRNTAATAAAAAAAEEDDDETDDEL